MSDGSLASRLLSPTMHNGRARVGMRATVIVRNPAIHDARVLREVDTLARMGYDVEVLAIPCRFDAQPPPDTPVRVRRLGPRTALGRTAHRLATALREPAVTVVGEWPTSARRARARRLVMRAYLALQTAAFYRRAIHALRERPPALLHCNDYSTMWAGVFARVALGSRVIYDTHELWADRNGRSEWRGWLIAAEALFVRAAHGCIVTSPGHADALARRYRIRRPTVVRNIPDVERRPASATASGTGNATAVYLGSVIAERGLEQAISALSGMPDLCLRIIGPARPSYRSSLDALIQAHGLRDRVTIGEPVAPGAVVDVARSGSFGIALFQPSCRSYLLGLPNKLSEYALAGLPVLASDFPVHRRFVEELGAGILVDPTSPQAIADGYRALLEPDRQAAIRRQLERAHERLDWAKERTILEEAYVRARA